MSMRPGADATRCPGSTAFCAPWFDAALDQADAMAGWQLEDGARFPIYRNILARPDRFAYDRRSDISIVRGESHANAPNL